MVAYCSFAISIFTHSCITLAENVYRCPSEVSVSWNIPVPPTGWDVLSTKEGRRVAHYLVSLTFSDGPPENGAFLRPTVKRELKANGGSVDIEKYDFSDHVSPKIWLVCKYGNTPATLTKSIFEAVKSCDVRRLKDLSEQEASCR